MFNILVSLLVVTVFLFRNIEAGCIVKPDANGHVDLTGSYAVTTVITSTYFSNCKELISIKINARCSTIANGAFFGCSNLKKVEFEFKGPFGFSQLQRIGSNAFYTAKLEELIFPPRDLVFDDYAFYASGTGTLNNITFTGIENTMSIGNNAFQALGKLDSIKFPKRIYKLGNEAFANTWIKNVVFAGGGLQLNEIGQKAFMNNQGLEEIVIPDTVTNIGVEAFRSNIRLKKIIFSTNSNLKTISAGAFYQTNITSFEVPSGVTSIGAEAFIHSKDLNSVTFAACPGIPVTIQQKAFFNTKVTKIILPPNSQCNSCSAQVIPWVACSPTAIPTFTPTAAPSFVCGPGFSFDTSESGGGDKLRRRITDDNCAMCAIGKYSLKSNSLTCSICDPNSVACGSSLAGQCKQGYGTINKGITCIKCPAGRYSSRPTDTMCDLCDYGKYSSVVGATSDTICTPCPVAKPDSDRGATSVNDCDVRCSAGTGSSDNGTTCTPCPTGKYKTIKSNTECYLCPTTNGMTCGGTSGGICQAGYGAIVNISTGEMTCTLCDTGYYSADDNNMNKPCTRCDTNKSGCGGVKAGICKEGYGSMDGNISCQSCSNLPGQYSTAEMVTCQQCPDGTYIEQGQTTCSACAAGETSSILGDKCDACIAGKWSAAGANGCTDCVLGQYSAAGSSSCTDCASGTTSENFGSGSCTICPAGKSAISGSALCNPCVKNTFSSSAGSSVCTACSTGKISEIGSTICSTVKPKDDQDADVDKLDIEKVKEHATSSTGIAIGVSLALFCCVVGVIIRRKRISNKQDEDDGDGDHVLNKNGTDMAMVSVESNKNNGFTSNPLINSTKNMNSPYAPTNSPLSRAPARAPARAPPAPRISPSKLGPGPRGPPPPPQGRVAPPPPTQR